MMRTIKSYVQRAGRTSVRQQYALENLLSKYELSVTNGHWDFEKCFGRNSPTIVEIGFGMGQSLVTMAKDNPDINYIGIEVHRAGVGSLIACLDEYNLTNVRVVVHDAVWALEHCVADSSLAGVQIFFPDPWPKKRHHKRRLIQTPFVNLLVCKLLPGAFLHCATDWQEYAQHMLEVLNKEPRLHNLAEIDFISRPVRRPLTKFESRGQRLGHGVWDLMFEKR